MVSIFNIISLVASSSTNNNNNDNNNNVNDNQGNNNAGQNSESNTNNDMMSVTQVMQVPPGAGRRKRSQHTSMDDQKHSKLVCGSNVLILQPPDSEPIVSQISSDVNESFLDDVAVGIMMSLNNWHYLHSNFTFLSKHCILRNICEMSYNCAMFGPGAELVCTFISHVISRDIAQSDKEESTLLNAAAKGSRMGRSCESWYGKYCTHNDWSNYTNNVKNFVFEGFDQKGGGNVFSI